MAITVGAAKEIFSLTRPLCTDTFTLSEYALQYKQSLKDMTHECTISFPSGHSAYIAAMLVALWGFLSKPLRAIGILTVSLIAISRIALGMHFIADVCFAIIMSIFIAQAVKHVMDLFFARRSKKKVKT
jgi:membrane-associated phospholipid phosphatase